MIYNLIQALDRKFGFDVAKAHCDVPCGVYDPIIAQINALSVVRMMDLMAAQSDASEKNDIAFHNTVTRCIAVKEEHAERAKHEIRVIFGDYIKDNHIEDHPELPTLCHKILQIGSKCRQTADREAGLAFVEAINQFSEIFWKTKGIATKRVTAPYAPALEMVYPDL